MCHYLLFDRGEVWGKGDQHRDGGGEGDGISVCRSQDHPEQDDREAEGRGGEVLDS